MGLSTFIGGVHPYEGKELSADKPIQVIQPKGELVYPLSQHIGAPAKPLVAKGDKVLVGQKIAEAGGFISANVICSVSGTVKGIEPRLVANGAIVQSIIVENDNEYTAIEGFGEKRDYTKLSKEEIRNIVKEAGIVGLGGAGFPTNVKLAPKDDNAIDHIIVNAAECEPYLTSDYRLMMEQPERLIGGIKVMLSMFPNAKGVIGIEENKPECIRHYRALVEQEENMEVCPLPAIYPQGGEKILIYHVMHKVVEEGKLPLDVGAIVLNCTTISSIARYCRTGLPLVKKCVTVDGSAVRVPKNVLVPIGMRMRDVFEACGGFKEEPGKVLYGGTMMGIAVPDLEQPILKNTNAILALTKKDAILPEPTACIRCGRCIRHCPLRLMPSHIVAAYEAGNMERLAELKVNLCMECGCCSFGCPAHRPLVQTNKLAKAKLAAWRKLQSEKLDAKKEAVQK